MVLYNFNVPNFHIGQVRSQHSDTLFASTALKVMNANGSLHHDYGAQGAALNSHKAGGGVDLNLPWLNVDVPGPTPENPDGGAVYWTFLLVNAGAGDSGFVPALNKVADAFAGALAAKVLDPGKEGGTGSIAFLAGLGLLVTAQEIFNMMTANCDGQVASGGFAFTAAQLAGITTGSPFQQTQNNPGTDSPAGCGSNSSYDVNYEITATPDVVQQHIFYRDTNNHLQHIFFDGPSDSLGHDTWTSKAGAPLATGVPATLVTPGQQHLFYRAQDNSIQHIFFDAASNRLANDSWSGATKATLAAGNPSALTFFTQQHVFYRGADNAIHHIFFDPTAEALAHDIWTQKTQAPDAAGDPATLVTETQQHVFYRGFDGNIEHIFFDAPSNSLAHDEWTHHASGVPRVPASSDPATLRTPGQQHVFYRGSDGGIHHLFFDEPSRQLRHDVWTEVPGAVAARGKPITMASPNQQHVFYRGIDDAIHHIFFDGTAQRLAHDNWTAAVKETDSAAGDPATLATLQQQHIFYRAADGGIRHILFDAPSNGFGHDDWVQRTGSPVAVDDPSSMSIR